ncbi:MAG: DEAD/DEAH box helicase [Ruminococcaceae bacterium]|nr:DEAD/DEAH box helicase [Oscillospiraceae bacterium]
MENIQFSPAIARALEEMGFEKLTEVQEKSIPVMRSGADLVAKAPTGTGKTFAFGIPLIDSVDVSLNETQAVVLAPTRELAVQINTELSKLGKYVEGLRTAVVYGGQPISKQFKALKPAPHIIVGTPGRFMDHMGRKTIRTGRVRIAVLDEADEMLDMGFFKDVCKIMDRMPKEKQLCLFSATITREVMDLMWLYQRDAEEIEVKPVEESRPKITQYSLYMRREEKPAALKLLLKTNQYDSAIVFCNTRGMTARLCAELKRVGFSAEALSSDVNQQQRSRIMDAFKAHEFKILVATDVAARGIDVNDVEAVFNFDIPDDNPYYLHRIGRTGRARKEGVSFVFYDATESARLKDIIRCCKVEINPVKLLPDGTLEPDGTAK